MMKQDRKPIQIDSELHNKLKQFCSKNGLVLKLFVEKLIKKEIEKDVFSIPTQKKGHK